MKRLLILLLFLGCADTYRISWDHDRDDASYDVYVMEVDSIIPVDTTKIINDYFVKRVGNKYYLYKTDKDKKKYMLVAVRAVDELDTTEITVSEFFIK